MTVLLLPLVSERMKTIGHLLLISATVMQGHAASLHALEGRLLEMQMSE
jgi:hypothetical protein